MNKIRKGVYMAPFSFVQDFEIYLVTEKRFSDHTVLAYLKDLNQFVDFALISSTDELKEVDFRLVRSWMVSLIEGSVSNRSVNRKISTLKTFFKWAQVNGWVDVNPMIKIKGPKSEKRLPSFAKQSEMSTVQLDELLTNDFDGVRTRLIIELFYQTGIRLSELIELRVVHFSGNSIKVLGKRNKERIIPIADGLSCQLKSYLGLRSEYDLYQSPYFFILNNGNKLYPKFVYRKINYYLGSVSNLDKKSPHVLRHTFATHMLNNGAGLEVLKEILGHANLSATQIYTHSSFTQLTNIYSQAHPRGHKKASHGN